MSEPDENRASGLRWRPSNFCVRLIIFSTALVIVATGISSLIVLQLRTRSLEQSLGNELLAIVNSTAAIVDGDMHDEIGRTELRELKGQEQFETIRRLLDEVEQILIPRLLESGEEI